MSERNANGWEQIVVVVCVVFFAVPARRQEKTYPAALPVCPIVVGCLGGIMGGFELFTPVHVRSS